MLVAIDYGSQRSEKKCEKKGEKAKGEKTLMRIMSMVGNGISSILREYQAGYCLYEEWPD